MSSTAAQGEAGRVVWGWVAVGAAVVAMVATLPGRTQGLGLITEPLLRDLELNRDTYGWINLWATLLGAAFGLGCGWLLDHRLSAGAMMAIVSAALGATVLLMTVTTSVPALRALILLSRGFGQSALSVVSLALLGRAFARPSGVVTGLYSVGVGVGFSVAFGLVGYALDPLNYGWRAVWAGIGWVLIVGVAPLGWLAARGAISVYSRHEASNKTSVGFTLTEALWTPAFWAVGLAASYYGLIASGISLFYQSVLEEQGFDRAVFFDIVKLAPLVGLVFNFLGGWLGHRWSQSRLLALAMAVLCGAMVALPNLRTLAQAYLYMVAMAFVGGTVTVVFFGAWPQLFGRAHLGQIQAAAQTLTVFASALGPLLLSEVKVRTGSYAPLFFAFAVLAGVLGAWLWFVPLPRRPQTSITHPDELLARRAEP
jgi:MFS family permease